MVTWCQWLTNIHRRGVLQIRPTGDNEQASCQLPPMLASSTSADLISVVIGEAELIGGRKMVRGIGERWRWPYHRD